MSVLAVAAVSARVMAESAADGGFEVVALDLFGDADTRRASHEWMPIGASDSLRIDDDKALAALHRLARRGDVLGWVAGSGFEALPGLLEQGAAVLPLIGTAPASVQRVRDPATFCGFLDSAQIGHPPISLSAPADSAGWLLKSARGTGGWHIRDAREARAHAAPNLPEQAYFQRRVPGVAMSATFIANGVEACVLGFNELIVRPIGVRPCVYCGAIGPVPLDAAVQTSLRRAVRLLAAEFGLRGLGSLDFMLEGNSIHVLELNPRPSASMELYRQQLPQGLMAAHVRACQQSELPGQAAPAAQVHGTEVVFSRRRLVLSDTAVARLAQWPHAHDLPAAGGVFKAGDPLCSLGAAGTTPAEVRTQLTERRDALLNTLETWA